MPISTINQNGLNAPLTLTAPVLGTPASINLANATNLPKAALPTGSVLQVVNATYSSLASATTSTFVDTGLSATITPSSSSSKILILVSQNGVGHDAANTYMALRLLRSSTVICNFEKQFGYNSTAANNFYAATSTNYLDSPATTSAVTYKTQMSNSGIGTVYCQGFGSETSTITLMEIAG
jgi:hypothetical protein